MNYIIFDIEATCWPNAPTHLAQETIEIGAVLVDDYGDIRDSFSRFVKPVLNPSLSSYCKELTNISQSSIDYAKTFPTVIELFKDWIDVDNEAYALCAWGDFDRKQLRADCKLHRQESDWLDRFVNLRPQYTEIKKLQKGPSLLTACKLERIDFKGAQHRALTDATNLAKIFANHIGDWDLY